MGKRSRRRGKTTSRQGRGKFAMAVVDPSTALEQRLAFRQDAVLLLGKLPINISLGNTPGVIQTLTPANLGVRAAAFSNLFSQYRFKFVNFHLSCVSASAAGATVVSTVGVLDDEAGGTDPPTSLGGVAELRCSTTILGVNNDRSLDWVPVNRKFWYYTYPGPTGFDPRLTTPAVIYGCATSSGVVNVIGVMTFGIVFKGAVDVGGS